MVGPSTHKRKKTIDTFQMAKTLVDQDKIGIHTKHMSQSNFLSNLGPSGSMTPRNI